MNIDDNCIIKPCGKCYYRADCIRCMLHEMEWVIRYKLSKEENIVKNEPKLEKQLEVMQNG
jgi:hypothetical protein